MRQPTPSRAVWAGYVIVTGFLVLTVAFGAYALASIGVGIARHGESLLYGDTLNVPLQLAPGEVGPLPPDVRVAGWPAVRMDVADPTTEQMLLRSAMDLGFFVLFGAGLWLLRGFLQAVRARDPFGPRNVWRLRALGVVLVVGAPVVELLNYALRRALYDVLPPQPSVELGVAGYSLPDAALLGGLGAFILAEVLSYGLRLREDVAATI